MTGRGVGRGNPRVVVPVPDVAPLQPLQPLQPPSAVGTVPTVDRLYIHQNEPKSENSSSRASGGLSAGRGTFSAARKFLGLDPQMTVGVSSVFSLSLFLFETLVYF